MAQFYANIQGSRGEVTRTGTKASGIHGHIRGWHVGVKVEVKHVDGRDQVSIFATRGSNGGTNGKLIARFSNPDQTTEIW